MKQYLMGIDNGGSEIKCAIFGLDGEEIAVAGRRLPISVPAPEQIADESAERGYYGQPDES